MEISEDGRRRSRCFESACEEDGGVLAGERERGGEATRLHYTLRPGTVVRESGTRLLRKYIGLAPLHYRLPYS